jgi:ketosteroid isomerase-like protein
VLRSGFGQLAAGAQLRAAIAMFFTFRNGKIASIRNYDCYYPF